VVTDNAVVPLTGGIDGNAVTVGDTTLQYTKFADAETVDVSLVFQANSGFSSSDNITLSNHITALTAARKDAVGFVSPERAATANAAAPGTTVATWRTAISSTSYGFADSSSLYVYDKYNDVYRWICAAGSMAGLSANADLVADAWFSPAGFTRGNVRNVTKLAYNPNQADRDTLYKSGVNPIVTFPGSGTVLFGDKTLTAKPSAFDRINVRRLFIVLEKAISTASKASLFEFNDEFTRAQFRNMVEPFLRDVKGRRGITDFKVICDGTNNTGTIIDTNKFVADIYIKPARSINFITLNFIATRTGVEFSEIAGGN
jgi:phage tail sheath protein FI